MGDEGPDRHCLCGGRDGGGDLVRMEQCHVVGLGGSTAFCDPETNTSIAITVNRLQLDKEVAERITDAITDALQIGQFDLM